MATKKKTKKFPVQKHSFHTLTVLLAILTVILSILLWLLSAKTISGNSLLLNR